jgi:hypothetical protein
MHKIQIIYVVHPMCAMSMKKLEIASHFITSNNVNGYLFTPFYNFFPIFTVLSHNTMGYQNQWTQIPWANKLHVYLKYIWLFYWVKFILTFLPLNLNWGFPWPNPTKVVEWAITAPIQPPSKYITRVYENLAPLFFHLGLHLDFTGNLAGIHMHNEVSQLYSHLHSKNKLFNNPLNQEDN